MEDELAANSEGASALVAASRSVTNDAAISHNNNSSENKENESTADDANATSSNSSSSSAPSCKVCFDAYDERQHRPFTLDICGHGFCYRCIYNLKSKRCPTCRARFSRVNPNYDLIDVIALSKKNEPPPAAATANPPEATPLNGEL